MTLGRPPLSPEEALKRAKEAHPELGFKKFEYRGMHEKVTCTCAIHGDFKSIYSNLIVRGGCRKCGYDRRRIKQDEAVKRIKEAHPELLVDKVVYSNASGRVTVTCKEHGDFQMKYRNLVNIGQGCPRCKESKGERWLSTQLDKKKIKYEREIADKVEEMRVRYDVVLTGDKTIIEYDGMQHFQAVLCWGLAAFKRTLERDKLVNLYTIEQCRVLIRIDNRDNRLLTLALQVKNIFRVSCKDQAGMVIFAGVNYKKQIANLAAAGCIVLPIGGLTLCFK